MEPIPSIRSYPKSDDEFAADVGEAIGADPCDPQSVEARLRAKYAGVRIKPQLDLAGVGSEPARWYCYRDGDFGASRGEARPFAPRETAHIVE